MVAFNTNFKLMEIIPVSGAKGLSHTIAASAVVDNGDGTVKLTLSVAHGLLADSVVYVEGTTNYDGLRLITAIPSSTTISIKAPFVAETPGGTETVKVAIKAKRDFMFFGFRLHLSAAPTTSENIIVTADSNLGSKFDLLLYTLDLAGSTDIIYAVADNENLPRRKDDIIRFAWDNTDTSDFGLEIIFSPLN